MYLDRIEIHGFKSFGNAIKINVPKGITGVIGPNGSGKSNVADAIRWVLGEQSAKSLRGSKMEDIIFAGTEKRKSLGYAEVAMHIKNDDEAMSIDYREVNIKRRVYRSGESEYFINGSSCRLKDVQELFMDTGVGKEGYSIIGQGQIDRVLSSKPEERRTLFEEAAGIYKYKIRRLEAEKKLDKQRENLTRINDIIVEIASRLDPLALEAEKTQEYLQLKEKLKQVEINLFINEIDRLEKELKKLSEDISNVGVQISEISVNRQQLTEKNSLYKQQKNELFSAIEELVSHASEFDKEQEKKHSQIEINSEKVINIEKLLAQIEKDKSNTQTDNQNKLDKLNLLQSKKIGFEIEKASRQNMITEEIQQLDEVSKLLAAIEESMDASKQELYNKIREIDLLKAQIQNNDELEAQQEYRILQMSEHIASLNSEIQHQEVAVKVLEKNKIEIKLQLEKNEEVLGQIEQHKNELIETKAVQEKALVTVRQNYVQAERQLKWLEQIKEDHEGYYGSVKQVLKITSSEPSKWQGVVGVVGELLEVPKEYETAIVTALGASIQYIVTKTEEDAKDMISLMKKRGISRATFLPKDTVTKSAPIKDTGIFNEQGFLGLGSDVISYDLLYSGIISSLLGRIIIVDNIKNASQIAKKYHYKYKLVTLDGEVFNSGGSLSGGSVKNQSNNIFSRNREMKDLKQKIVQYNFEIGQLEESLTFLNEKLKTVYEKWDGIHNITSNLENQQKDIALEFEKLVQTIKLKKNTQLQIITEKNTLEDALDALKIGKQRIKDKLEVLEENISDDKSSILILEEQLIHIKEEKEQITRDLTQRKIELSTTEQNLIHISEQVQELKNMLDNQDEKYSQIEKTIKDYLREKEILLDNNKLIKQEIGVLEEKILECHIKRKEYDARKIILENEEIEIEEAAAKSLEQLDSLKEEKYRLENKKQSLEIQKQSWGNTMWEQYEMTYNNSLSYKKDLGNTSELKKYVADIKAKVRQIGHVNVNAVEEYSETKTRYEFLSSQKEDIERAEIALLEMIKSLTLKMQDIFKEQFEKIAFNFTQVFRELFGGGEAYLQFSDTSNILESGIEIIAKPPGKKLQNMSLLSGGERTLTAISLLFGILKLKPSPFCVLDEIESALDDANVLRFAEYLHRLSDETQFIVITHRKGTMERAHTLYGVTMQERGVSTVLSIQLEDATAYLDQKKTS
ncbi:chromosome segregation protein SMC [Cellulosilyticum sp. I15G10I2]|uniref:chromosome segregation protein SMC n=1 Tax=Cellulosilyticum sp. I15G10I2 TaxID=1892843 RepID=UPI00085BC3B5|nr:chromosome segregation protein SMC [Cellulosilyticum sp. I15G10I2]